MDFSFRDNNACGAPKPGQDSLLKKDFVASPEAKSIDNKAGERTDGKSEAFPGSGFLSGMPGGQTGSQFQGFLGASRPGAPEKTLFSTDVSGFSQPAMNMSANMNVGMAPFQSSKPPSLAEPQKTSTLHANEPPKPLQPPSKPSDTSPLNTSDTSAVWGNPWTGEDKLSTELSHSPNKPEQNPTKPLGIQGYQDQDATSEKESNEGGQQKRKKKCDDTEEVHGLLESLRSPEKTLSKSTDQEGSSPPSPGESWKSEIREWGGGRIQAKKSKSRTKLPEEWATMANTSSPSPPPGPSPSVVTDMDVCTASTTSNEQGSAPPSMTPDASSLTTTVQSVTPTASQTNVISPSTISDPSQSTPVVTGSSHTAPDFTSGFKTSVGSIPSPQTSTTSLNISTMSDPAPSLPVTSSTVVSQNPPASASLTSLTKHQEPPLTKSPQLQVKEGFTAKDKTEKMDTTAKMDSSSTLGKADKPEKTEKIDTSMKKESLDKNQEAEKKDHKPEKNEKVEKAEKTNNEGKEEKKNGSEKVDKMVKNEKNEKAGKETVKPTTANGNKELISPDSKAKADKQNSAKPNSHSTGENSASKKGPASKTTTPTSGTKKLSGTTSAREAKTPENGAPPQRKPPVPKFNGSTKSNTRTARGSSAKTPPRTTPTSSSANANAPATLATNGTSTTRPSRITKPPVPKQVPLPRKPPVPRAPRNNRIANTPLPDLKNVSSKIGSTDNMKYQPGGGKIQIVHKKLDFSHVTSRCGSKDNIKHVPGGGNVQIQNKKVDVSKVTAKCGSKDNIKHKPGGGDVESPKTNSSPNANEGSPDDVSHKPEGDQIKAGEQQQKSEGSPPAPAASLPSQADKGAKESGLKEGSSAVPSGGEGFLNSQGLDKRITATN
ncbi:microtubule-associated protein tau-like [Colossoma macropomum]|uniref:microtubule-associated protein tau-like n=1 Tax=Colossoma macropomum TaxID=42526 RepID=UPI001864D29D|nr:microtubule-associated protein tau-like [Colossoma macropomum]